MLKAVKRITFRKKLNLAVALVCLAAAVILLFVPDITGVADDGTCTTVLAAAGLSRPGGGTGPGYLDVRYTWRTAEYTGARNIQALILCLAKYLCYWITGSRYFDLRYLAGIYLVMYLPAVFIITRSALSRTERRGSMITVAVFAALIFSDAGYITYFNSLYPEALIFILLLYAAGAAMSLRSTEGVWPLVVLAFSGGALCFVRGYFFPAGIAAGVFCLIQISRDNGRQRNMAAGFAGAALVAASIVSVMVLPPDFHTADRLHSMTRGVLFQSEDPEETLAFFGIDQSYALLTDISAYAEYPLTDGYAEALEDGFYPHCTPPDIARYYLAHPGDMASMLNIAVQANMGIQRKHCGSFPESARRPEGGQNIFWTAYSFLKDRSFPKTAGYPAVLVVACMALGWSGPSLLRKADPGKRIFFQTTLFLAAAALVQTMYIIIRCGDAGLGQYNSQLGIILDILLFFTAAEIADRLNIFRKEKGK